ncbi:MAG: TetR/AcrR family transcriptional regulator [Oscillospiraceae bacterium]|nr:TetR/AcrR family transcriptional regulator [Oscillospiraceae bacterium]
MPEPTTQNALGKSKIHDAVSDKIIEIVSEIVRNEGAHKVTVRKIVNELGRTNRVFYNRFANCDEVLKIVYHNAFIRIREHTVPDLRDREHFFQFCIHTAVSVLKKTYAIKWQFRQYLFEHDSETEEERQWWNAIIKKYYQVALKNGFVRPMDEEALCFSIWCFCRGYYSNAIAREIPAEEAVRYFTFGFTSLLNGLMI